LYKHQATPHHTCMVKGASMQSKPGNFWDHVTLRACCTTKQSLDITITGNDGVWTGCVQRQYTPSRQQVAWDETAKSLIPLSFPTPSLSVQPVDRQSQRCAACSCWTGRCHACCPPRAREFFSLAHMLQGRY